MIVSERILPEKRQMSEIQQSDALKKLVWFIIALAILAIVLAMLHYFAIDLPIQQAALHAPTNGGSCNTSEPAIRCRVSQVLDVII
jgi:hypothetical protein